MRATAAILVSRGASELGLERVLSRLGWRVTAPDLGVSEASVVLVDPDALERDVESLCPELAQEFPGLPVVVVGESHVPSAIRALRAGASDYLDRAGSAAEFQAALDRARFGGAVRAWRERRFAATPSVERLCGESAAKARLRREVQQAALSEATAILVGESGTGKELVARLLHEEGPRAERPFVVVGCASIPSRLAESELFGYERGAFSGALSSHPGLLRAASGGTLFLDDIGALPLDLQAKLLRSLQERAVRSVGSDEEVPTDFRLVVSSLVPLDELVRAGRLRADLYYRLAVLEIRLPSLRERELDVLVLAEAFCADAAKRTRKRIVGFTPAFEEALLRHSWPGNVRELRNAVDFAVAVARFDHLGDEDLPRSLRPTSSRTPEAEREDRWEAMERRHIEAVLRAADGNRSRAAEQLGIDRKTLQRKLERFGIDLPSRSGMRLKVETEAASGQSKPYRFNFR